MIRVDSIPGCEIEWGIPRSTVAVAQPETKSREVVAIFLCDPNQVIATLCCIHEQLAKILVPDAAKSFFNCSSMP